MRMKNRRTRPFKVGDVWLQPGEEVEVSETKYEELLPKVNEGSLELVNVPIKESKLKKGGN